MIVFEYFVCAAAAAETITIVTSLGQLPSDLSAKMNRRGHETMWFHLKRMHRELCDW